MLIALPTGLQGSTSAAMDVKRRPKLLRRAIFFTALCFQLEVESLICQIKGEKLNTEYTDQI